MTLRQHYARPRPPASPPHHDQPRPATLPLTPAAGISPPREPAGDLPAACAAGSLSGGGVTAGSGVWAGSCGCPVGVLQAAPCGEPSPPLVMVGPAATAAPPNRRHTARHHHQ